MIEILCVDDDRNNRMTLQLLLEEFDDIQTTEAADGQEAIELCRQKHFDIILMDIMMPNVNGITATSVIKAFDNKTMILALSALDDETSKNQMLASGAEDYMTKPIEDNLFHQRIANYIQIVQLRKLKPLSIDAINPFSQEIYSRSLKFNIYSPQSLAEFWDYYLNQMKYDIAELEDCIRIIYAIGQFSLKNQHSFSIVAEENDDNLFLTLELLETINDLSIQHILVKNYKNGIFILKNHLLSFRLPKAKIIPKADLAKIEINDYTQSVLAKTHFNKTRPSDYVQNTAISLMDKIENLENIRYDLETAAIEFEKLPNQETLYEITSMLSLYIDVIDNLMEFEHFAYALTTLNDFLKTLNLEQIEAKDIKKFSILFLSLLDDIEEWRKNIFILQEANDIHYLDSSLLSTCLQIQSIFSKQEISRLDEDEFELF
ncbi:MAG: response regulator [Epsilonproteobacteria bacterium]|nr:response regulator [Campylobacterota bacterium]